MRGSLATASAAAAFFRPWRVPSPLTPIPLPIRAPTRSRRWSRSAPFTNEPHDPRLLRPQAGLDRRRGARATAIPSPCAGPASSNFELVYNGQIILLDAFFDRGGNYPPLGFGAADVKKANVILLGHAHFDHMSDAASVGIRTGATIVGAPVTTEKLKTQGVPDKQIRTRFFGRSQEKAVLQRLHRREPVLAAAAASPTSTSPR